MIANTSLLDIAATSIRHDCDEALEEAERNKVSYERLETESPYPFAAYGYGIVITHDELLGTRMKVERIG